MQRTKTFEVFPLPAKQPIEERRSGKFLVVHGQ
jgi:hypothetical protein